MINSAEISTIGKYKIYKSTRDLKIRYQYTLSDLLGIIIFLLALFVGALFLLNGIEYPDYSDIFRYIIILIGAGLVLFGLYMIIGGLYNPINGILQIRYTTNEVIIREFPFIRERININEVSNFSYRIESTYKPSRQLYSIILLQTKNGDLIDCFIVRSSIPIDITRKVEKDLHQISRSICLILREELKK